MKLFGNIVTLKSFLSMMTNIIYVFIQQKFSKCHYFKIMQHIFLSFFYFLFIIIIIIIIFFFFGDILLTQV